MFKNAWNHHSLRTMHNSSPYQLYTSGALRLQQSNLPALDFFDNVDTTYYGVDEDVLSAQASAESVSVPDNRLNITPENLTLLQLQIDPLAESDNFGMDIYAATIRFLEVLHSE